MAVVKIPPSIALGPDDILEFIECLDEYKVIDAKGRYLHWHDFRFRVKSGTDPRIAWAAVKKARSMMLKDTGLFAENGQPFQFCLPDSALVVLHKIEQLGAQLGDHLSRGKGKPGHNLYLVESLMMEEAISSAQLEGACTTRTNAKKMLETERPPQNDDERMVLNNFLLMKLAKASKEQELSIELIRRFQATATSGVQEDKAKPGEIRQDNGIVVAGKGGDEIAHQPPDFALLVERLEALCEFANANHSGADGKLFIHPAVKAIILHFMIGYEHAFNDGNGRTARALFYWYMIKCGYWGFEYISISALLKNAPVQYGESYLFTETDDFDLTYFVNYQLSVIERAMGQFLSYLDNKNNEYLELAKWIFQSALDKSLNSRQVDILNKMIKNPGRVFTTKELMSDFGVSEGTARSDLERLKALKLVARYQEGKAYFYVARSDGMDSFKTK
jgi:Fic family protein